jgi:aminomethyltransferase
VDGSLAAMKYYTGVESLIAGHGGIVSRTGYTGEDGCELIVGSAVAQSLWQTLIDAGAVAAGLGSRDTLRLEAAMPLYGHELTEDVDPFTAGLDFAVNLDGRSFPGSDALRKVANSPRKLQRVGLELAGKRVAREGDELFIGERSVGRVTSGTFSPTFDKPLAMGYVSADAAAIGTSLVVNIRGRNEPARVVSLPFYSRKKAT